MEPQPHSTLPGDPEGGRAALDHGLASYFEISLDLLCVRDRGRRINRVNKAWTDVLGYSVEELEGIEMISLVHPDDVASTLSEMARVDDSNGQVWGFVNRYRRKDGDYRSLEWRAQRVGERVYGAARDVTERLLMEREIEAARAAAEASNQAKTDFLANISHEIRTPLNGVIGVVAALARTDMSVSQREMVELIESSGLTLERLVSDLLDITKIETGSLRLEVRPFAVHDLDATLETARLRAADKGLDFVVERSGDAEAALLGDLTRVRQVLDNLLSNAVKFTSEGQIHVRLEVGDGLKMEVEDTGVGFPPEFAERLFTRFSQADSTITRRFGGTGLGLSICKSLVEMMGGRIEARSRPGQGSVFRVEMPLPRTQAEAPTPAASIAWLSANPDRPLRILLAEDHLVNQRVVALILQPYAVALTIVADGAEAVAAHADGTFDLILMDMQMPGMDGLAATRAIRAQEIGRARTPVAMLSANALSRHREQAEAAGADIHIAKPVTAQTLLAGVAEALAKGQAASRSSE